MGSRTTRYYDEVYARIIKKALCENIELFLLFDLLDT